MRKYLGSHLYEASNIIKSSGKRKPLRTFLEMCEEFGVSEGNLRMKLSMDDAPSPVMEHSSISVRNKYYDPDEMRKWWKSINLNKEMK